MEAVISNLIMMYSFDGHGGFISSFVCGMLTYYVCMIALASRGLLYGYVMCPYFLP
jgi:hypothetical protein